MLTWRRGGGGGSPAESRPGLRVGALVVALLLVAVICASHQLTPFMVLIAITALTLSGRVWPSRLPLIAVVLLTLWLVYPASAYLIGNPPLAEAGLQGATEANVIDRLSGTAGHVLVVQVRIVLTLVLWALAAAGAVRDWRRGRLDIRVVLLAVTPLLLFPAQLYGGEMLIRVSLFALPFVAVLACSVLLPTDGSTRPSVRCTARTRSRARQHTPRRPRRAGPRAAVLPRRGGSCADLFPAGRADRDGPVRERPV